MPAATEPRRLARSAMSVLSERMVPMGVSRCHAATPWGNGSARLCRTPDTLELQLDGERPRVQFAELGPRRVRLQILEHPLQTDVVGKLRASSTAGRIQLTFELGDERPLAFILTL